MQRARRRHRRWWVYLVGGLVVLVGALVLVVWLTTNHAHEVSLSQAEARARGHVGGAPGASRPAPGVYQYTGSGVEHLTLPPLSQAEGPSIPGTVTLEGKNCWVFRVDYSTHHWQTWDYCRHGADTWEAGGQTWQLWSIGPIDATNLSTFHCSPRTMALPASRRPGQTWWSRCTGTNTSVKGVTVSSGPYRFVDDVTLTIGGRRIEAAHFERLRTDSGAQHGYERSEVWFATQNGLPLRVEQQLKVTSATPFGTSTYTQSGVFTLRSLAHHS